MGLQYTSLTQAGFQVITLDARVVGNLTKTDTMTQSRSQAMSRLSKNSISLRW